MVFYRTGELFQVVGDDARKIVSPAWLESLRQHGRYINKSGIGILITQSMMVLIDRKGVAILNGQLAQVA